jgi:predicted DCC family thiol-disulfide oxidoreductase YuxK
MKNSAKTTVLYNASCPVCNFEIQHLNSDARVHWGLDADAAAKRLYVLHEGKLSSGIPAFLVLWAQMPRYRWLAWTFGLPGIFQSACWIYDFVLAPVIYRLHLRRMRKRATERRS